MREIRESTTHCNEKDGYITPAHYYGKNYQMIEIIQDQLTPDGVRGYCKGIALKYLYGINGDNALRRLTKAKYYLDELVNYLKRIAQPMKDAGNHLRFRAFFDFWAIENNTKESQL